MHVIQFLQALFLGIDIERVKAPVPGVSTGGYELQFTRAVSAMIDRHAGFEYTRRDGLGEGGRSGVSLRDIADPKGRGSAPARPTRVPRARDRGPPSPSADDKGPSGVPVGGG